jgi:hypothetical protein
MPGLAWTVITSHESFCCCCSDEVSLTFCPYWLQTMILPIIAFPVARISDVSHCVQSPQVFLCQLSLLSYRPGYLWQRHIVFPNICSPFLPLYNRAPRFLPSTWVTHNEDHVYQLFLVARGGLWLNPAGCKWWWCVQLLSYAF